MNIDEILDLLERYQRGNCTEEERKAVHDWYDSLQLGNASPLNGVDIEESLARVKERLPGAGVREPRIGRRTKWYTSAAAAVVLLGLSAAWLLWAGHGRQAAELGRVEGLHGDTLIITGKGETRQLTLPDGSSVQLNAGSVFCYPRKFSAVDRTVKLVKGEAYFQISPDPRRPFYVVSCQSKTRVLGTSFDIRAYEEEKATQIALLTGKVQVTMSDRSQPVELSPHQLLRLVWPTGKVDTAGFENESEVAAWKEGALSFKDAAFETVAFEIGNKFNVRLINSSKKQQWSYTGLFRDAGLQEVMETICQTEHLSYTFRDNEILIVDK